MTDDSFIHYADTTFWVHAPAGRFGIRVGQGSERMDDLLRERRIHSWAYITAWNPAPAKLSLEENAARQTALIAEIRAAGRTFLPGVGVSRDGSWSEDSVLVLGVDELAARELGQRYGQAAIVFGHVAGAAQLLDLRPDRA